MNIKININIVGVIILFLFQIVLGKNNLYQSYHPKNDLVHISSLNRIQGVTGRIDLPETYITEAGHFKIHYTTAGNNAIDTIGYVHEAGRIAEYSYSLL